MDKYLGQVVAQSLSEGVLETYLYVYWKLNATFAATYVEIPTFLEGITFQ